MYIVYGGEVLNMSILDINKHRRKLKVLCFKNRHKTIYQPLWCNTVATNFLVLFSI